MYWIFGLSQRVASQIEQNTDAKARPSALTMRSVAATYRATTSSIAHRLNAGGRAGGVAWHAGKQSRANAPALPARLRGLARPWRGPYSTSASGLDLLCSITGHHRHGALLVERVPRHARWPRGNHNGCCGGRCAGGETRWPLSSRPGGCGGGKRTRPRGGRPSGCSGGEQTRSRRGCPGGCGGWS